MHRISHTFRICICRFLTPPPIQLAALMLALANCPSIYAAEDVPHRPFAQWADLPERGQFIAGAVYEQSEAGKVWAPDAPGNGAYDIHLNQGFLALQYGLTERWALDFNFGYTVARFRENGLSRSTEGILDWSFGARYQLLLENPAESAWRPTATFRAGAVLPGSYNQDFPFSPGLRSAAIEPELLLRKHFGWEGLGAYGDGLYRWNRTTGNDQYLISLGLFQQFKGWELDAGWRHLQTLSGSDISFTPENNLVYPRDPREISDTIEAGLNYTTAVRRFRYAFDIRTVIDGNNADDKFWFGFSADFPFGGKGLSRSADR